MMLKFKISDIQIFSSKNIANGGWIIPFS